MRQFIREARAARKFPLDEETPAEKLLEHLNMLHENQLSNAAVLLFGKRPQQFILSSEVRCAHYHGTMSVKPIPSYQVYEGSAFSLVDAAVDFVLSKINLRVGTRAESNQAPRTYEIPPEVVSEAIVNAVAHRDYTHSGCVQVMLFADRLEIFNPGSLRFPLTIDELGKNFRSLPPNPLLANGMYLNKYIERMGTGVADMMRRCAEAGLPDPEFSADGGFTAIIRRPGAMRATPKRTRSGQGSGKTKNYVRSGIQDSLGSKALSILHICASRDASKKELLSSAGYTARTRSFDRLLDSLLAKGLVEMTIPDKPRSRAQRYRLTSKGRAASKAHRPSGERSQPLR